MDLNELFSQIWQLIQGVIGPPGGLAAISILCPIFVCIMCNSGDIPLRVFPINPLCGNLMTEKFE